MGIGETSAGLIVTMLAQMGPFLAVLIGKKDKKLELNWKAGSPVWIGIAVVIPVGINLMAAGILSLFGMNYEPGPFTSIVWIVLIVPSRWRDG